MHIILSTGSKIFKEIAAQIVESTVEVNTTLMSVGSKLKDQPYCKFSLLKSRISVIKYKWSSTAMTKTSLKRVR